MITTKIWNITKPTFINIKNKILKQNEEISLIEALDERGYSLLHEACFHNDEKIASLIVKHATETMKAAQLTAFVNLKTSGDGFTALHFCSFKGNTNLC